MFLLWSFERARALGTVGWGGCIAGRALRKSKGGGWSQADEDCSHRTVDNHNLREVTPTSPWRAYKIWSVQDSGPGPWAQWVRHRSHWVAHPAQRRQGKAPQQASREIQQTLTSSFASCP